MKAKAGEWAKVIGGNHGVLYDGHSWKSFKCIGCMIASGKVVPSWRVAWTTKHQTLYAKSIQANKDRLLASGATHAEIAKGGALHDFPHDVELHNSWLLAGKPFRKE